jgi:hypothetical protein
MNPDKLDSFDAWWVFSEGCFAGLDEVNLLLEREFPHGDHNRSSWFSRSISLSISLLRIPSKVGNKNIISSSGVCSDRILAVHSLAARLFDVEIGATVCAQVTIGA